MNGDLMKRLKEDTAFEQKLSDTPAYEARLSMIREEGYAVKSVRDYIERTQKDEDFFARLKEHCSFEAKAEFVLSEGYYFTMQDLSDEHDRIAQAAQEELAVVSGGKFENDQNSSCCQTTCPKHFKCTWG